jgi:hypothetical protein
MAINTPNLRNRSKRTSVVALGLVALLAGVAVAYFLTSAKFAGNKAVGGQLTVDVTGLPADFSSEPLYPTTKNGSDDFATQLFSVTNNNTVPVTYKLFATCEECIPDPADTPDEAAARQKKIDQFNNLYVEISLESPPACPTLDSLQNKCPVNPHYKGRLADLTPANKMSLGNYEDGASGDFEVHLWLNNVDSEQPQQIQNIWEFFVDAQTPTS